MTLKQLRESKYMLQLEVAEKAFVSPATVSTWESGKHRPDLRGIRQLAAVFGVTPEVVQQALDETQAAKDTEFHSDWWDKKEAQES
jgi:transcriptional regulator with XRE-family HTH domain